jgi:hypothetical protein
LLTPISRRAAGRGVGVGVGVGVDVGVGDGVGVSVAVGVAVANRVIGTGELHASAVRAQIKPNQSGTRTIDFQWFIIGLYRMMIIVSILALVR